MNPLWPQFIGYGAEIALATVAVLVALRRAYHWPVAVYACARAIVDPARAVVTVFREPVPPHPLVGMDRVLYHVSAAGFQGMALAVAVLAAFVFAPRARWHVVGAAVAVIAVSVIIYPIGAGKLTMLAAQGVAVGAGLLCLVAWLPRREWSSPTAKATIVFLAAEVAVLAGPFTTSGKLSAAWPLAWSAYLTATLAGIALHVPVLTDHRDR